MTREHIADPAQPELFSVEEVGPRSLLRITGGYPARPGSGPEGETCKSCKWYRRVKWHDYVYRKCGAVEDSWTHGAGSDIKAGSPACRFWEKPE